MQIFDVYMLYVFHDEPFTFKIVVHVYDHVKF